MCGICGCGESDTRLPPRQLRGFKPTDKISRGQTALNPHVAAHISSGAESLDRDRQHNQRVIEIEKSLHDKNDRFANENRQAFGERRQLVFNLLSSPGSGKTSLLVRTLTEFSCVVPMAVIEGDQQSSLDADRIRQTGAQAHQVNTGKGCHLEAKQVGEAYRAMRLGEGEVLFIENVGNLVCPAGFDLGEALRVVVLSVTEGEDKPLKYPDAFQGADWVLINKVDLLPYLDFDMAACRDYINRINPRAKILGVSAKSGEGMQTLYNWIENHLISPPARPLQAQ